MASASWGNSSDHLIKRAQVTLNKAGVRDIMSSCNWLDLQGLTRYHSLLAMLKIVHWRTPSYMESRISNQLEGSISTKGNRLQSTGKMFRWNTVRIWNTMSVELREETNITRFKRGIKRWLLDNTSNEPQGGPPPLPLPHHRFELWLSRIKDINTAY